MTVDEDVFRSENETGDRNRAIAYLMRNFGMIDGDVDEVLDLYFRQCSLLVSCRDLAVAAATLAAGGRNPVTGQRALSEAHVSNVLSVMQTCGMYDFAGSWTYDVGLPAKSGVSGGVIAVLPGQLGIAVFSPPLDRRGNSVRGIEVCRRIVRDFDLHPLRTHEATETAVIGRRYDGRSVRSTRILALSECDTIEAQGPRLEVFELQGRLVFADTERMLRAVLDVPPSVDTVILEGHRLAGVDPPAVPLLHGLARSLRASGQTLVLASFPPTDDTGKALVLDAERIPDLDAALEWWEDRILAEVLGPRDDLVLPLADQELLRDLTDAEVASLEAAMTIKTYAPGEVLAREGEDADSVFFLLSGRVSVWLRTDDQRHHGRRLASFGAGVAVGEMALLDAATPLGRPRARATVDGGRVPGGRSRRAGCAPSRPQGDDLRQPRALPLGPPPPRQRADQGTRAMRARGRPVRSGRTSTSTNPAARAAPATTSAWCGASSSTSTPPGSSHSGASPTRCSRSSSPDSPLTSASTGSCPRTSGASSACSAADT